MHVLTAAHFSPLSDTVTRAADITAVGRRAVGLREASMPLGPSLGAPQPHGSDLDAWRGSLHFAAPPRVVDADLDSPEEKRSADTDDVRSVPPIPTSYAHPQAPIAIRMRAGTHGGRTMIRRRAHQRLGWCGRRRGSRRSRSGTCRSRILRACRIRPEQRTPASLRRRSSRPDQLGLQYSKLLIRSSSSPNCSTSSRNASEP